MKRFAKNKNKINYKDLCYKLLFPDSKFQIINFLKKYDTLSIFLEGLVTKKMTVSSANADQISFIINLMYGYSDEKLYGIEEAKSNFFCSTALIKSKNVFLNTKKNPRKEIKSFPAKNFNKLFLKEQINVLLDAMQLYNYRNKIIALFENKKIRLLCMHIIQNLK